MSNTLRTGIAMIELIFAIMVMGIALLSVPMVLSTATKSSIVSFQQEAIAMAASHTNALMTYAWDEQNTDSKINFVSNILHTGTATVLLTQAGREAPTFGTARDRVFDPAGFASAVGNVGDGNLTVPDTDDDVDDFNGRNMNLTLIAGAQNAVNEGEYIDTNISINTTVTYGSDAATYDSGTGVFAFSTPFMLAAPAGRTFIKLITTRLTSTSVSNDLNDKQITLKAFMCNIGAVPPNSRGGY